MKIWASLVACNMHVGIFDLEHVNVIWVIIRCTFPKIGPTLKKTAYRRAKGTKIWSSWSVCNMHVATFDLEHVKVIWGHWYTFPKIGP